MSGLERQQLLQSPTISEQDASLIQDVWSGSAEFVGLKSLFEKCLYDNEPALEYELLEVLTTAELQIKVALRFKQLKDFVEEKSQVAGINTESDSSNIVKAIALLALQIETAVPQFLENMKRRIQLKYRSDQTKVDLLIARGTEIYVQSLVDSIQYMAAVCYQKNVQRFFHWNDGSYSLDETNPSHPLLDAYNQDNFEKMIPGNVAALGEEWKNATPLRPIDQAHQTVARKKILAQIAKSYPSVVNSMWSAVGKEPYVYLEISPKTQQGELPRNSKVTSNEGLKHALDILRKISPGQNITDLETEDLDLFFQSMETAKGLRRIHIMAGTKDQPLVIHRLLMAMQKNPDLQDAVHTIKVRVQGNNEIVNGEVLPEIDVYTDAENLPFVLRALQILFVEMHEITRTASINPPPRFCSNVGKRLLYVAFGDGDIKRTLARLGFLDSVYDASSKHVKMRV